MKKIVFLIMILFAILIFTFSLCAADIVFTENGVCQYKIGATENWLKTDENAASFEDFVKIISEYSVQ